MMADVSRNGSGGFNVNDKRSYDPWGNLRSGAGSGDPKGRYCANLGHFPDSLRSFPSGGISAIHGSDTTDESGLITMRARYYEPSSGRFISEDPQMQGSNWFEYASCNPVSRVDQSGSDSQWVDLLVGGMVYDVCKTTGQWVLENCIAPLLSKVSLAAFQIGQRIYALGEDLASSGFDQVRAGIDLLSGASVDDLLGGEAVGEGASMAFCGAQQIEAGLALMAIGMFLQWGGPFPT